MQEQARNIPQRLCGRVPQPPTKLEGRGQDKARLINKLNDAGATALMNGMGGVGKSTLAAALLHDLLPTLKHYLGVTQAGDFVTSLLSDRVLLDNLGVPRTEKQEVDAEKLLHKLAALPGPNLLVIDNAEKDVDQWLDRLPGAPEWQVLLTSREELRVNSILRLQNLDARAGFRLFTNHYQLERDEDIIRAIVEDVGGHALTIELLAKTAQTGHHKLVDFYARLQTGGLATVPAEEVAVAHAGHERVEKVFPYLTAAFQLTDVGERELYLLKQLVLLPAIFVPFDLLCRILRVGEEASSLQKGKNLFSWIKRVYTKSAAVLFSRSDLTAALSTLARSGWLVRSEAGEYKMHPVVQQVVAAQLREQTVFVDVERTVVGVTGLVEFDEYAKDDSPVAREGFFIYGETLVERLETAWDGEEKVIYFFDRLATLYEVFGRYREAAVLGKQALAAAEVTFGSDSVEVDTYQSNLAVIYLNLGRYPEAAGLLEAALKAGINHFGEEHPTVQISRSNLGEVYRNLGRYPEAVDLLEAALKAGINHSGEEHPTVQIRRSNLANIYGNLGRYPEAADLLEAALMADMSHFGEEHPTVQIRRSNLGEIYRSLGRYPEAAALLEAALKSEINYFGEEHPTVQISRSNLALVYGKLGR
ncbi:MAG: tetratricopeptide repeat protein, partial [Saprospiraceae bacterium]